MWEGTALWQEIEITIFTVSPWCHCSSKGPGFKSQASCDDWGLLYPFIHSFNK